jgi:hypothetical protein
LPPEKIVLFPLKKASVLTNLFERNLKMFKKLFDSFSMEIKLFNKTETVNNFFVCDVEKVVKIVLETNKFTPNNLGEQKILQTKQNTNNETPKLES